MNIKKKFSVIISALLSFSCLLAACNVKQPNSVAQPSATINDSISVKTEAADTDEAKFVFGDTTFNAENEEADINPQNAYSGWACIRYGVGETLFRYNEQMELEPLLAESYRLLDDNTWEIVIKDKLTFSNGRKVDAAAVKASLEALIAKHERAKNDLQIAAISADAQTLVIKTTKPNPTLINALCDPYAVIIDTEAGISPEGMVVGTGPYVAKELVSSKYLKLVKNPYYREGEAAFSELTVLNITDGDTLSLALQAGEIDAAYGLPYAAHSVFKNDNYSFSSSATSRVFFLQMNFKSKIMQDAAVRKAIAMGIDKERFVKDLLKGNGYVAGGIFPDNYKFGGTSSAAKKFDLEEAKAELEKAGWQDKDGDGIREKDGQKLLIRWLTYPSRQELPLLAEAAQATLQQLGFEVVINTTTNHNKLRKNPEAWDVYASALVTAPTADPAYFFQTAALASASANNGQYYNAELEALAAELARTFDKDKRFALAKQMEKIILDDDAFVFVSHLKMTMISKANIQGLQAYPCDYYEISHKLKRV